MVNLIEVLCEVSVEELLKQQSELQNTRDKCTTGIAVLELCINAARVAQRSKVKLVAPRPGPPVTELETPPVAAQERIQTIERAPSDTSEEDAAAEVEAVFADAALSEVTQSAESVTMDIAEEIAVPPAEVVTTPKAAPEPPITKRRTLSPDVQNPKIPIGDRAKLYLDFFHNATAMAIGNGIDLPEPTQMAKHLQKDSRFEKDPRGFWKLSGT